MVQQHPTAGIILAAGTSSRFGRPKQLLRLKDRYLIEWVLDAALSSELGRIILVLGYAHQQIRQALGEKMRHAKLQIELNPRFQEGQSLSLKIGLSRVMNTSSAVMFLLADQPLIGADTINCLVDKFWSANKDIGVPTCQGKRGTPSIFRKNLYPQIMKITGDTGARRVIREHPDRVLEIEIENPHLFVDIDTPDDFKKIKRLAP